jgi:hypothetical protein
VNADFAQSGKTYGDGEYALSIIANLRISLAFDISVILTSKV